MFEPSVGEILQTPGVGIKAKVYFSNGPEGMSLTVVLEEKDYTLAEVRRLAVERAYEMLKRVLDAKQP